MIICGGITHSYKEFEATENLLQEFFSPMKKPSVSLPVPPTEENDYDTVHRPYEDFSTKPREESESSKGFTLTCSRRWNL